MSLSAFCECKDYERIFGWVGMKLPLAALNECAAHHIIGTACAGKIA